MRRDVAEKILGDMKRIDEIVGELAVASHEIDDVDVKKKIRRALIVLVFEFHKEITLEIVKQFPDLQPDKQQ
jgi:hypothetical protein